MQAPSAGSPATHRRGGRVWLAMGLVWCALATAASLMQPPGPVTAIVPATRSDRGLRDWWRFPVERHAFLRLPSVSGHFTAMAVDASGRRGWLAGEGGALVATVDGGASWQPLSAGTERGMSALHASDDGRRLWAVGERGTIVASADGGLQWRPQPSGTDRDLQAVEFAPDERRGWAVGDDGVALSTDDGGGTWRRMAGLGSARLKTVRFDPTGRVGVVLGEGGQVFMTEDNGQRWRNVGGATPDPHPSDADPSRLVQSRPPDPRLVPPTPVQSIPVQSTPPRPDAGDEGDGRGWVAATLSASGNRVGLISDRGAMTSSDDGGKTWTSPTLRSLVPLERADFSRDGQRGVAISPSSWISSTPDGGRLWRLQAEPAYRRLAAVRVSHDGQRAWVVGAEGALVTSGNGGVSWSPATRGALDALSSVGFSDDHRRGWAVGTGGAVLRTEDGGASWHLQLPFTPGGLGLLHVSADGMKAWAMDLEGQRVIHTPDGGASWEPGTLSAPEARAAMTRPRLSLQPPMPLPWGVRAGYVGADGLRGWAVGDGGLLLTTRDGGRTWTDPRVYARYPAPWFWLALLLSVPMFLRAWLLFTRASLVVAGMADTPATDAALTDPEQDRLNFEPLAAGISRFLRNPATEPPLTLAITGDWGSGKSSLMGLVCADLRKHGSRPIWFNAWHHQKEDHLFAALLGALSKQALPPWLSLDGIGFRLRLLWMRSRKHWVFTVLLCAAVAALVTLHVGMNDPAAETRMLQRIGQVLGPLAGQEPTKATVSPTTAPTNAPTNAPPLPWAEWLALLTVAGTTLAALRKAMTAFGADPAALLAGGLQGMSPKLAAEQNSFRTRFAEQFGEVSRALPERVVVVIDDLDRCRPEAVLEIMEAVNFLTSSGQCFVLFGMATDKVQAALAIAFERIAKELASASSSDPNANPEQAAREQRRAYAANYLQKLINLEIKVPTAQSYEAWRLLTDDPSTAAPSSWRREAMAGLHRHAMWLALAVATAGGVSLGVLLRPDVPSKTEAQDLATASASTAASAPLAVPIANAASATNVTSAVDGASAPLPAPVPGLTASDPARAWGRSPAQSEARVLVQSGATSHADEWIVAGVLAVGFALAGLLLLRAASRRHREATDSKDFRDALKVWTELVRESAHTPRAVKRFGNKLRYFEMLQQGEERDLTLLDDIRARLRRFAAKSDDAAPASDAPRGEPNRRIAAQQLVALGALHEVFGPGWLSRFKTAVDGRGGNDPPFTPWLDNADLAAKAQQMIEAHGDAFGTVWPPSPEEVEVFTRLLDGIRMPGESEELDMRRSFENSLASNAEPNPEPNSDRGAESGAAPPSASPASRRPDVK